ncbi:MAG: DUF488 family protein [Stenotrophobium sp.]
MPPHVFTIGHSTHPLDEFLHFLTAHGVMRLADVRSIPRSRRNPQFNADALPASLAAAGMDYVALRKLGGRRRTHKDSLNTGWRNDSFRGYADYMLTPEFEQGLARLRALAAEKSTAIMCAESVPWRCHRSLIADALLVRGVAVDHIMTPARCNPHRLTPFAHVDGTRLTYPAPLADVPPEDLNVAGGSFRH